MQVQSQVWLITVQLQALSLERPAWLTGLTIPDDVLIDELGHPNAPNQQLRTGHALFLAQAGPCVSPDPNQRGLHGDACARWHAKPYILCNGSAKPVQHQSDGTGRGHNPPERALSQDYGLRVLPVQRVRYRVHGRTRHDAERLDYRQVGQPVQTG